MRMAARLGECHGCKNVVVYLGFSFGAAYCTMGSKSFESLDVYLGNRSVSRALFSPSVDV
jgi:hypothetical protein